MKRTTVILATIAVAMLAFILIYERDTFSSRELEERSDRVLGRFDRERISALEIERGGTTTLLVREPDEEGGLELGEWKLRKPFSAAADQDAVRDLLGELEWLDPERELGGLKPEDAERFGFTSPRIRVWYTIGKRRVPITIGKPEPRGAGVYLQVDDPQRAFVVGEEIFNAFDHDPGHFHTKELHEGVSIFALQSLTLRDENGERVVEKRGDDFWLVRPFSALALYESVEKVTDALDRLRSRRFVARVIDDPAAYGLEAPVFEAVYTEKAPVEPEGKGDSEPEPVSLRFRLGARCEGHEGESYLAIGEKGPVVCVADADLAEAHRDAEALRDRRLLAVRDREIESVAVVSRADELGLQKQNSEWSYQVSREGKKIAEGKASAEAVEKWLKDLRAVEAIRFLPADDQALRDRKINESTVTLRAERAGKRTAFVTRVGRIEAGEMAVRRGDEPLVAIFPATAAELLRVSSARFRPPELLGALEGELVQLEIRRGDSVEELVRDPESGWSVQKPSTVEADTVRVGELAGLLGSLKAERFAADALEPEHGLDYPALEVKARFRAAADGADNASEIGEQASASSDRDHTLAIGSETEGGRYARLDSSEAVFVVSERLVGLLSEPLVSRSLLSTPLEQIDSLKVVGRERTVEVTRDGDRFALTGGGGDDSADNERAAALAKAVAGLRAAGAVHGEPGTEGGLDEPRARIAVMRKQGSADPRSYELLIGAEAPARSDSVPRRYVKRTDIPVVFTVAAGDLDLLLE